MAHQPSEWKPEGARLPGPPWRGLALDRELLYNDGPLLLLRKADGGQRYLAWLLADGHGIERWLYLPLSEGRLRVVLSGGMDSREAILSPEDGYLLFLEADLVSDDEVWTWTSDPEQVPTALLPLPGARLHMMAPDEATQQNGS